MSYGLYIAKVVKVALTDNRLQVKVLPHMQDFPELQCPIWSCFFRDELLIAKKNELVWVVCDDEFSNGYVIGPANYSVYRDEDFKYGSIPTALRDTVDNVYLSLKAEKFNFTDLKVTFWNNSSLHMIEKSTGGSIIAFRTGAIYIMRPNELIFKIGPSAFTINAEGISAKGNSIHLQSDDVALGNNPVRNVLTSFGDRSDVAEISESVRA